jgi:hypothetical protein
MTIRPSLATDVPVLTAIYGHHVLHGSASFEIEPPDEAEMTRRCGELLRQGMPHLVLEAEGIVRGYAYAGLYRPRAAYRNTVEDSVYLAPDATGLGYGHLPAFLNGGPDRKAMGLDEGCLKQAHSRSSGRRPDARRGDELNLIQPLNAPWNPCHYRQPSSRKTGYCRFTRLRISCKTCGM